MFYSCQAGDAACAVHERGGLWIGRFAVFIGYLLFDTPGTLALHKRDLLAATDADTVLQRQVAIQQDGIDRFWNPHSDHLKMPHRQI